MMKSSLIWQAAALSAGLVSCAKPSSVRQVQSERSTRRSAVEIQKEITSIKKKEEEALRAFIDGMTLEEKAAQLFMTNLEGDTSFVPVKQGGAASGCAYEDSAPVAGGYLFFSYNIADTPEKIMRFTDSIKQYCRTKNIIPPLIALDHEGGNVSRLRTVNAPLPSAKDVARRLTTAEAYTLYALQARQIKLLGFNMNIAPVAESIGDDNRAFLDDRSFGTAEEVIAFGRAAVNAYENNGVAAVLKHFPGNSNTDPHSGLPEIRAEAEELEAMIAPFAVLAALQPAAALMSHARTRAADALNPACFSEYWVLKRLRRGIHFDGVIFSDDIFMAALAQNGVPPETAAVRAVEAGVNCIMISEKRFSLPAARLIQNAKEDSTIASKIDDSVTRLLTLKIRLGLLEFTTIDSKTVLTIAGRAPEPLETRVRQFNDIHRTSVEFYKKHFE